MGGEDFTGGNGGNGEEFNRTEKIDNRGGSEQHKGGPLVGFAEYAEAEGTDFTGGNGGNGEEGKRFNRKEKIGNRGIRGIRGIRGSGRD